MRFAFFDYVVSLQGVSIEDKSIEADKTWPEPKLVRDFLPTFHPGIQQDSHSTHFNAQDELMTGSSRELDIVSGCGSGQ